MDFKSLGQASGQGAGRREHAGNHFRRDGRAPHSLSREAAFRGAQLVAGRQLSPVQRRRPAVHDSPSPAASRNCWTPASRIGCNNDHGLSFDGKWLAISDQHDGPRGSTCSRAAAGRRAWSRPLAPSYWHGWSPDGKTLAYCAERDGNYDVYTIPVEGGPERRLTTAEGLDDGPEYSPDGKYIYFNSERSGLMKIWRMNADGTDQEQVTLDRRLRRLVSRTRRRTARACCFFPMTRTSKAIRPIRTWSLRLMPLAGGKPKVLAQLFGGQGTINVPSWSPDSRSVAFVSYRLVAPESKAAR